MSRYRFPLALGAMAGLALAAFAAAPSLAEPSIRSQKDTIGYATAPAQVAALVRLVDSLEAGRYAANERAFPAAGSAPPVGAVCPHDDYLYAGRGYVHAMRLLKARRVILFGVSHTARRRGIQGKLVFDAFDAWRVGGRDCPVSPLRNEIVAALPPELVLVSDEIHAEEHSLEGFVPVLQHYLPDAEIVPVLATRQTEEGFARAADALAAAISGLMSERGWKLGEDVAILVSADCVHYGDEEWGGRNYAPFGTGAEGYEKGVRQDLDVISRSLAGDIDGGKIALFREMVDSGDFQQPYRITWCGVYSIPLGLGVLDRLCSRAGRPALRGFMLVYGTSFDPPPLPLAGTGLGTTAINNLRHWVGYTAIGYW